MNAFYALRIIKIKEKDKIIIRCNSFAAVAATKKNNNKKQKKKKNKTKEKKKEKKKQKTSKWHVLNLF